MQAPRIRQFLNAGYATRIKVGPWYNSTSVWQASYKQEHGEIREFTAEFNKKLVEYFTNSPPKVGDIIYIEGPFRIIKVFYNFNHDRYEIWWKYETLADMADVVEDIKIPLDSRLNRL